MALFHVAGRNPAIQRKCNQIAPAVRLDGRLEGGYDELEVGQPKKLFIRASASLSSASLAA